jgi:septal ring factor EnvC (AmiA/AmiB activator)
MNEKQTEYERGYQSGLDHAEPSRKTLEMLNSVSQSIAKTSSDIRLLEQAVMAFIEAQKEFNKENKSDHTDLRTRVSNNERALQENGSQHQRIHDRIDKNEIRLDALEAFEKKLNKLVWKIAATTIVGGGGMGAAVFSLVETFR